MISVGDLFLVLDPGVHLCNSRIDLPVGEVVLVISVNAGARDCEHGCGRCTEACIKILNHGWKTDYMMRLALRQGSLVKL